MKPTLWEFKARLYRAVRTKFPFSLILEAEKRNLALLLQDASNPAKTVLDVGTGNGQSLDIFPADWEVVGMDRSYGMIRHAQGVRAILSLVTAKAQHLPVADASIPLLSAIGLVEYLEDPDRFLIEAARVIRSGGWLLSTIAEPNFWNLLRNVLGSRIYPLNAKTWETMLEKNGFQVAGKTRTFMQTQILAKRVD